MTESKEYLQRQYNLYSAEINRQLQACSGRRQALDRNELFKYLVLNLLSVRADWDTAVAATNQLDNDGHLYDGSDDDIKKSLKSVDYSGKGKPDWVGKARTQLYKEVDSEFREHIEDLIRRLPTSGSPVARRTYIIKMVKGLGLKTASHFLRGVNLSDNKLAILDTHVLQQLLTFPEIAAEIEDFIDVDEKSGSPKHPSNSRYLAIEKKLIPWATHQIGIPMDALDLLLWRLNRSGAR